MVDYFQYTAKHSAKYSKEIIHWSVSENLWLCKMCSEKIKICRNHVIGFAFRNIEKYLKG